MSWTKLLTAAIVLALLDAFLTSRSASSNVGGAETGAAGILAKFLDAGVPAFGSSSSSTTATSTTTGPAPTGTATNPTGPAGPVAPTYQPSTTPSPNLGVDEYAA